MEPPHLCWRRCRGTRRGAVIYPSAREDSLVPGQRSKMPGWHDRRFRCYRSLHTYKLRCLTAPLARRMASGRAMGERSQISPQWRGGLPSSAQSLPVHPKEKTETWDQTDFHVSSWRLLRDSDLSHEAKRRRSRLLKDRYGRTLLLGIS